MRWMYRRKLTDVIRIATSLLLFVPCISAKSHKDFPEKYSDIYMPVSLAIGSVRTAAFPGISQWYDILVQVEKPLPFRQMRCMMGVTASPLESKDCSSDDPLLQANWTVWEGEHIVAQGSIPNRCACAFEEKHILKLLGSFAGATGKKYVVEVKFSKDGTPLNAANPHLIVIQHKKFW